MNFLPAKVTAVDAAGATVQLPGGSSIAVPAQPGRLKAGDAVTLGVRPEHLRPAEVGEISGEVMVVERLGGETFLYTQIGGRRDAGRSRPTARSRPACTTRSWSSSTPRPATCSMPPASPSSARQRHPLADIRRTSGRKAS